MGEPITLVITVTLPNGYLTTLRNIGSEAAYYVDAQLRDAGVTVPVVTCLVVSSRPPHDTSLDGSGPGETRKADRPTLDGPGPSNQPRTNAS